MTMKRKSKWQGEGSQGSLGPVTLDSDVIHTGRQFEQTNNESGTTSSELAENMTVPNCAQMGDSESCVLIDDGPIMEESSGPESTTDSSNQEQELKELENFTNRFSVANKKNDHWSVPSRSDPWNHLSLSAQTSPEYIQELRQGVDSFKSLSRRPTDDLGITDALGITDVPGITGAQSVQTDSGYASIPKGDLGSSPIQTGELMLESHDIPSTACISEPFVVQKAEDARETQTIYSDQTSEDASKIKEYIWEFTNYLYQKIGRQLTAINIERATKLLPELLGAFAKKMGQTSPVQINRDIMYFVYKNRKLITQSLKIKYEDDRVKTKREPDAELMTTNDKIYLLWSKESDTDNVLDPEGDLNTMAEFDDGENDNDEYAPEGEFSLYRDAILKDPSFEWLIERFSIELNMSATDFAMTDIRRRILDILRDDERISRKRGSKPFKMTFNVNCDILAFVREQEYHESAVNVILKVLALTGTTTDVQAATSEQYLRQTWPTIGCYLLYTIQDALRKHDPAFPFQNSTAYTYADQTNIKVSIGEGTIRVEAIGTSHSIAEIGEQIGWLASTFSSAPKDSEFRFHYPEIPTYQVEAIQIPRDGEGEFQKAFVCRVEVFEDREVMPNSPNVNGQCWHALFNNPVIVKGYPINRRRDFLPGAGLELPFDILITLAYTQYLTTFGNNSVVKGFSTALIPTMIHDDIIYWHLLFNKSGAHIPYRDPRMQQGIMVTADQLRSARRHIVGWCANAQNNIGSPDANYDIKSSGLYEYKRNYLLDKIDVSVGFGSYFNLTSTFKRGRRERPPCGVCSDGYQSLVNHIGDHYFNLYDVNERRGWLSSGQPALLHLVLASLKMDEKNKKGGFFSNAIEKLDEIARSISGAEAAKEILSNSSLWNIPLYLDDLEPKINANINGMSEEPAERPIFYYFKDRVKQICFVLEQAIEKLNDAIKNGDLKGTSRNILAGYNFKSIAENKTLQLITRELLYGIGWTDFTDSLETLTLFGNGFGELIKPGVGNPAKSCSHCGFEASLPSGKDYLAVCCDVLEEIVEDKGSKEKTPWRLIDDYYCHFDRADFEICRCTSPNTRSGKRERIQAISSESKYRGPKSVNSIGIVRNGAVIFGHKPIAHETSEWIIHQQIIHKWRRLFRKRLFRKSHKTMAIQKDSSPSDNAQLQANNTVSEVPTLLITLDGDSETNENQRSDTVSSTTPNISTSSAISGSDSNNTTIEQQSLTSDTGSPKPKIVAAIPKVASAAPQIVSGNIYGRKVRDIYRKLGRKQKFHEVKRVSG